VGLPKTERHKRASLPNGGKRQRFTSGTLYLNPASRDVFALWGEFDQRYRKMGEATSPCGYPTSSVTGDDVTKQVSFQKGTMTWSAATGLEVDC
jgi:hypothetical protein